MHCSGRVLQDDRPRDSGARPELDRLIEIARRNEAIGEEDPRESIERTLSTDP